VSAGRGHRALDLFALAISIFAAAATLRPIGDLDLYWHLRTGEWILGGHGIPHTDPFSHTFFGQPWRLVDWGAEVLLALLHRSGGAPALIGATAVLAALALLSVAQRMQPVERHPSMLLAAAMLLLVYASAAPRFTVRPQMFMFVLATLELGLLEEATQPGGRWLVAAVPPLLGVWSNLHGSSFLGLALLIAYVLARLPGMAARDRWLLVAMGLLGIGAAFLAPNPTGRLASVTHTFLSPTMRNVITEWLPTPVHTLRGPAGVLLALIVLGFLVDYKRVALWEIAVYGVVLLLAMRTVRFVPLAALALGPPGYRHLAAALARLPDHAAFKIPDRVAALLLVAGALVLAFRLDRPTEWLGFARRPRLGLAEDTYPIAAADVLAHERPRGNMFNSFLFGGYLVWRLAPDMRVFVDGRTSIVYDDAFLSEVAATSGRNFHALFAKYHVSYAIVAHGDLAAALDADPDWRLIYFDDLAAIFVAREGPDAELAERRGYRGLSLASLSEVERDADRLKQALEEVDRAVREAPGAGLPLVLRAMLRGGVGDEAAFARDLAAATVRNPRFPDPWYRLGKYHLASGRAADARRELARAVALRPQNGTYRQFLALACLADHDPAAARAAIRPLVADRDPDAALYQLEHSPAGQQIQAH